VFVFWLKVAYWVVVGVRRGERFVLHPKVSKLWVFV
jgi:hypothetical protein